MSDGNLGIRSVGSFDFPGDGRLTLNITIFFCISRPEKKVHVRLPQLPGALWEEAVVSPHSNHPARHAYRVSPSTLSREIPSAAADVPQASSLDPRDFVLAPERESAEAATSAARLAAAGAVQEGLAARAAADAAVSLRSSLDQAAPVGGNEGRQGEPSKQKCGEATGAELMLATSLSPPPVRAVRRGLPQLAEVEADGNEGACGKEGEGVPDRQRSEGVGGGVIQCQGAPDSQGCEHEGEGVIERPDRHRSEGVWETTIDETKMECNETGGTEGGTQPSPQDDEDKAMGADAEQKGWQDCTS
uniref:Uncharacterized protein n=1 Tax=Chromera velia CCMP2878 TaxID=1169474 RepID=A0A0G4HGF9_9ALVE|eukprot:Cvel_1012.t1-p1 / transcript=Cvel_1012.t1 / gene=Cvel_1012 / organism=Chromera_velia_CCMP2878 / gene_product=hypothetical protein / transcript_product=hypothetical protein / location=Cvel_scaffold33:27931-30590(+) / protein_length=302 / sequence_SO=supercontig / SO=protein_coding / is_pseudo=false